MCRGGNGRWESGARRDENATGRGWARRELGGSLSLALLRAARREPSAARSKPTRGGAEEKLANAELCGRDLSPVVGGGCLWLSSCSLSPAPTGGSQRAASVRRVLLGPTTLKRTKLFHPASLDLQHRVVQPCSRHGLLSAVVLLSEAQEVLGPRRRGRSAGEETARRPRVLDRRAPWTRPRCVPSSPPVCRAVWLSGSFGQARPWASQAPARLTPRWSSFRPPANFASVAPPSSTSFSLYRRKDAELADPLEDQLTLLAGETSGVDFVSTNRDVLPDDEAPKNGYSCSCVPGCRCRSHRCALTPSFSPSCLVLSLGLPTTPQLFARRPRPGHR